MNVDVDPSDVVQRLGYVVGDQAIRIAVLESQLDAARRQLAAPEPEAAPEAPGD